MLIRGEVQDAWKNETPYPNALRQQMIELVKARTRIASLMRAAGIEGASGLYPPCFVVTTQRDKTHDGRTDLVNRNFVATRVNQLWVGDTTYVPT